MRPERKWALFKRERLTRPNLDNASRGSKEFSLAFSLACYCLKCNSLWGLGFREVICIYHVLSCTTDPLIVLILHVANPGKQETAHSFFTGSVLAVL